ncbi:MAG: NAD(+) synthase [Bacillota bacterium]|nr:NAD(+) synthase [Bacillota bacterium]
MNAEIVTAQLVDWLRNEVEKAGCRGVVVGISGGVDSAVVAAIAKKAFPTHCMGLFLPCESNFQDLLDGQSVVESLDMPNQLIELDDAYRMLVTQLEGFRKKDGDLGRMIRGNIKPRLRMLCLYFCAQSKNYLVLGTSNKSEIAVGYATKYGDSGVDLQLLGDFYKEEVYELARYLEVPSSVIEKAPSGGLWQGQTDEIEMGVRYESIDRFLQTGEGEPDKVAIIKSMMEKSEHKKKMPPIAVVSRD